jgi:hypothetical protein
MISSKPELGESTVEVEAGRLPQMVVGEIGRADRG